MVRFGIYERFGIKENHFFLLYCNSYVFELQSIKNLKDQKLFTLLHCVKKTKGFRKKHYKDSKERHRKKRTGIPGIKQINKLVDSKSPFFFTFMQYYLINFGF